MSRHRLAPYIVHYHKDTIIVVVSGSYCRLHSNYFNDCTLAATEAERRRRENRVGDGMGMGSPLPQPTNGAWGSVLVSSSSGVRGRAPAENVLLAYLRPTEHSW